MTQKLQTLLNAKANTFAEAGPVISNLGCISRAIGCLLIASCHLFVNR